MGVVRHGASIHRIRGRGKTAGWLCRGGHEPLPDRHLGARSTITAYNEDVAAGMHKRRSRERGCCPLLDERLVAPRLRWRGSCAAAYTVD